MRYATFPAVTTTEKALEAWKEKTKQNPLTATNINLDSQLPPIVKIGPVVKKLVNCQVLSLSCNMIENPTMSSSLKNLRVLNLSRNNLKSLRGIEYLGKTLEELWVSYNSIIYLSPIESMKALKVFYCSHNNIRKWNELKRLASLPKLIEISFYGNPIQEVLTEERFRLSVFQLLPKLNKLDFVPFLKNESH